MELYRDINNRLDISYQCFSLIRSEQCSHILDTDRISTSLLDTLSVIHIILMSEYFTKSIGDSYLSVTLLLIGSLDSCLEVSYIVKCIEYSDDIDTICDGLLYEILYQVISVMTVAQHILSSEQHLELCVGHFLSESSESLPGIFIQETDAGIKCSTAPAFSGIKTYLIHC